MMPDYDPGNRAAALIILQDPARYAGLMTEWATLWLAEHPDHGTPRKGFKREASRRPRSQSAAT